MINPQCGRLKSAGAREHGIKECFYEKHSKSIRHCRSRTAMVFLMAACDDDNEPVPTLIVTQKNSFQFEITLSGLEGWVFSEPRTHAICSKIFNIFDYERISTEWGVGVVLQLIIVTNPS
jgi:hypothetical protein